MKYITSLDQCQTREDVVNYINDNNCSSKIAALYAYQCAKENGCLTVEEVNANLDLLIEDGAEFNILHAKIIANSFILKQIEKGV